MKKIGFVDYFLDEWHANNYPEWIKAKNKGFEVAYAYGEVDKLNGKSTEQWCEDNGIERCKTIEELCEKSDVIAILSPDNSERHLMYAEQVLPFGKLTYIDKTFAPDSETAEKIFALSEKYHCPICSTSALRFATELENLQNVESMMSVGGGMTYDIYAIHQLEMIVKLMGANVKRVIATQNTMSVNLTFEYADGRRASLIQTVNCYDIPFMLLTKHEGETDTTRYTTIKSEYFQNFIDGLLAFFETGKLMATKQETLAVIRLIDNGKKALSNLDNWIEL